MTPGDSRKRLSADVHGELGILALSYGDLGELGKELRSTVCTTGSGRVTAASYAHLADATSFCWKEPLLFFYICGCLIILKTIAKWFWGQRTILFLLLSVKLSVPTLEDSVETITHFIVRLACF